jgi:elongation factor G
LEFFEKVKVSRMVKMHSNEMEDINEAGPGEIFAIFGLECSSGDTFTEGDNSFPVKCSSMHVPPPVI